jgi:hypothetical protein
MHIRAGASATFTAQKGENVIVAIPYGFCGTASTHGRRRRHRARVFENFDNVIVRLSGVEGASSYVVGLPPQTFDSPGRGGNSVTLDHEFGSVTHDC